MERAKHILHLGKFFLFPAGFVHNNLQLEGSVLPVPFAAEKFTDKRLGRRLVNYQPRLSRIYHKAAAVPAKSGVRCRHVKYRALLRENGFHQFLIHRQLQIKHHIFILEVLGRLIPLYDIAALADFGRFLHNRRIIPAKPHVRRGNLNGIAVHNCQRNDFVRKAVNIVFHHRLCVADRHSA